MCISIVQSTGWYQAFFPAMIASPQTSTPAPSILPLHPTLPHAQDLMMLTSRLASAITDELQAAEHLAYCEETNDLGCNHTDLEHLRSCDVSHSVEHVLGLADGILH